MKRSTFTGAGTVLAKELRETLRDRKTLLVMVVLPLVLYPLMFVALSQVALMQRGKLAAEELPVAVGGGRPPPALAKELAAMEVTPLVEVEGAGDPEALAAAVREGRVLAALELPADAVGTVEDGHRADAKILFDGGSDRSREARERLEAAVRDFEKKERARRLEAAHLPEDYFDPMKIEAENVASASRQGGWVLGQIVPLLISVLMIGATFYPAIDLTAGEKERGTLQTLLTAPITPLAIVVGKFGAVVGLALISGLMNLASVTLVALSIPLPPEVAGDLAFEVSPATFALVLLCLLLMGAMFGAVMMAVAVTARSFKEAQNYLTPVYLVAIFPLMIVGLPGIELTPVTAIMPVLNLALAIKQLLVGPVPAHLLLAVGATTAAWILLALLLAARVFQMESVLVGDAGLRALFHRRGAGPAQMARAPVPSLGEAFTLLGLSFLALFYGSVLSGSLGLLARIHLTQWGALLLPALAFVLGLRLDPRATLSLRRPPAWSLAAAILLGSGLWYAAMLVLDALAERGLPLPGPELEGLSQAFVALGATPETAVPLFLGVALAPAICEEILFRGVLLSALAARTSRKVAVVASAGVFALFHLNLYQLPTTFVVGLVLALLVLRSGSIWPAVLLHGLHNGLTLAFQLYADGSVTENRGMWALLLAPLAGGAILALKGRATSPKP